jgi:hypothetical protein
MLRTALRNSINRLLLPQIKTGLDLKNSLRKLACQKPFWPTKSAMLGFARESLNVQHENEGTWYQSAWWGFHAAKILDVFREAQRNEEIVGLLEKPVDWSIIRNALGQGKGAIILSAHLGPGYVPGVVLKEEGYQVLEIGARERYKGQSGYIYVGTPNDQKLSLVRARRHLKSNAIVLGAPTGRLGERYIEGRFLGLTIPIYVGLGELARLTEAPTFWSNCTWSSIDSIDLSFEPMPTPTGQRDEWLNQWYGNYFERLAKQMIGSPADLGFRFGFWETESGGLYWYRPRRIQGCLESLLSRH